MCSNANDSPDAPGNVPIPNEDPGPWWREDGWDSEGTYLP